MNETTKSKILVVEDNVSLGETLAEILSYAGYDVDYATNGAKALKQISRIAYDLIISDISMPGISGLELLERINTNENPIPFIVITGFVKSEFAIQAVRLGASDFISKPIDFNVFLHSVSKQLAKHRKTNEIKYLSKYIESSVFEFRFTPEQFIEGNLTPVIANLPVEKIFNIPNSVFNEILLCVEEMLSNAFLHGVFKIPGRIREEEYQSYMNFLQETIRNKEIAEKKVYLTIFINMSGKKIEITVRDEGDGFDHSKFLQDDTSIIEFKGSGKGIKLLKILCDNIFFADEGRILKIEKNF